MIIELHAQTNVGLVRKANEDNYLLLDLSDGESWTGTDGEESPSFACQISNGAKGVVLAVSDGLGGALAGEVASRMTVELIRDALLGTHPDITLGTDNNHELNNDLMYATIFANSEVYKLGNQVNEYRGMGATLTGAAISDGFIDFIQVGDSRGYLIREDEIKQITKDQSLVQQLIDLNQLAEEDAEKHPFGNIILQALGTQGQVSPTQSRVRLTRGDILLLCSDGLSKMLRPKDMLRVISQNNDGLSAVCERLINEANNKGGDDNITVVIARFDGDDLPPNNGVRITIETSTLEKGPALDD